MKPDTRRKTATAPETMNEMISGVASISWPALTRGLGSQLASMLFQLEQSQWWSAETLRANQFRQLRNLLSHAFDTVPHYREPLRAMGYEQGQAVTAELWRALPLLSRTAIQEDPTSFHSTALPPGHGRLASASTSGSTGQTLTVNGTELTNFFWMAFTLREHLWHRRDFSRKSAFIRYYSPGSGKGAPPHGSLHRDWGPPVSPLYRSGPSATLSITSDTATQAAWLRRQDPHYLLSHPSNLEALARRFAADGPPPNNLLELRSIGEILSPAQRELFRETFGVPVVDIYSCNEVGYIALQCPDCHQYHVQSENVLVEVLDERGTPCAPGETGRVIVTGLHNFAMPLLRYELRDYATVGEPGACGRGLPALKSIVGRRRNMFTLPNGEKRWATGFLRWADLAPISQVQFIQRSVDHVEARVVPLRELTRDDEELLTRALWEDYGYEFRVSFTYLPDIQGHGTGKFEEFISQVE